jgi:activator of 2-hydroxyglutaryl-CoA dehydratase
VIPVTSQCSVFAETEVISLISKRNPPEGIAAGIYAAVAKRVFGLARRVGVRPKLTITGGCAKSPGLRETLARVLRQEIVPLAVDPQLVGALGAAVIARRRASPRPAAGPARPDKRSAR